MPEYLIVDHNVEKPDLYGEYAAAAPHLGAQSAVLPSRVCHNFSFSDVKARLIRLSAEDLEDAAPLWQTIEA